MQFTKEELENEEWLDIKGYEGLYKISSLGRLENLKNNKIYKIPSKNKYQSVRLTKNKIKTYYRVHRIVAIHFIPNPENKTDVNHKDGFKNNNKRENLEWATKAENTIHAHKTGLIKNRGDNSGTNNPSSKLSEENIVEIYVLNKFMNNKDIAKMYGIKHSTISAILLGKAWKKLYNEYFTKLDKTVTHRGKSKLFL